MPAMKWNTLISSNSPSSLVLLLLTTIQLVRGQGLVARNLPPNGLVEAFPVPMPMPMQMAVPGVQPVFCARKPRPPGCPACPPCLCMPACTPAFFAFCSPCHLKCRCKDGMPPPVPLPPVPPVPVMGPAFPLPVAAPPQVMLVPIPPLQPQIVAESCPKKNGKQSSSCNRHDNTDTDYSTESDDDSSDSYERRRSSRRSYSKRRKQRKHRKHSSHGRGKMRLRRNLNADDTDVSESEEERGGLPTWSMNNIKKTDDYKPVLAYVNKQGKIRIDKRISADDVEHIKRGNNNADEFKPVLAYLNGHGEIKVDKRISAHDAAKLKNG